MSQPTSHQRRHRPHITLLTALTAAILSADASAQSTTGVSVWNDPFDVQQKTDAAVEIWLRSGAQSVGDAYMRRLVNPLRPDQVGSGGHRTAPPGVTPETASPSAETNPFGERSSSSSPPVPRTATTSFSTSSQAFANLAKDASALAPQVTTMQPVPSHQPAAPRIGAPSTFSSSPSSTPAPGGISLSFAAAMGLVLDFDLDGFHYKDGTLIVSGKSGKGHRLDLGLFMTALRLACLNTADPYFSLDPDDGAAWSEESRKASDELAAQIDSEFPAWGRPPAHIHSHVISGGNFRIWTVSAKRDYPQLWRILHDRYRNLRTRLVFRPDWLRETRLGEILYIADVLLKELTDGVPTLSERDTVRAATVTRYRSVITRSTARGLLAALDPGKASTATDWKGFRMWFDFAPTPPVSQARSTAPGPCSRLADGGAACFDALRNIEAVLITPQHTSEPRMPPEARRLRNLLRAQGFDEIDSQFVAAHQRQPSLPILGDRKTAIVDLTQVFPQMFVRRHDHTSGNDVDGNDPDYSALAGDVNRRLEDYAAHYPEIRDLITVFRSYTAAVALVRTDKEACKSINVLLDSERVSRPLPTHHLSELSGTVGEYHYVRGRRKHMRRVGMRSVNGGIALRGDTFYSRYIRAGTPTAVTRTIVEGVAAGGTDQLAWTGEDGRHFVRLDLKTDIPPPTSGLGERISLEAVVSKQREALARQHEREQELARVAAKQAAARDAAVRQKAEEERTRRLAREYGTRADETTRQWLAPFALAATEVNSARPRGNSQAPPWRDLLRGMSYSDVRLDHLERLQFAALAKVTETGVVIIAYGIPTPSVQARDSLSTRIAEHDLLARAATDIAWAAHAHFGGKPLILTGAGAGADLAVIAGQQAGLDGVITFNASASSRSRSGPRQVDVAVIRK